MIRISAQSSSAPALSSFRQPKHLESGCSKAQREQLSTTPGTPTLHPRRLAPHFAVATLLAASIMTCPPALGQTGLASVYGRVTDSSGAIVIGAEVEIKNADTNEAITRPTDQDGLYTISSLRPGHYNLVARKAGFKTVTIKQLTLNVQGNVSQNITLEVGDLSEAITVTADSERLNTTDGSVSTVIEREMVENLPLNGRSFQSLLELTPGINPAVPGLANGGVNQQGQFTVNGQRGDANYFIVDGVSANTGSSVGPSLGQSGSGSLPATTALGGFNGLVSIDALQEFRVTTSSFAPEYGHTPGGQVSLLTRSGTNSYHGTIFDYFRNTILDANDWFLNSAGMKGAERQNDFGGVFGGPIVKNKLFAFLSYEGLRLTNPQAGTGYTFTQSARKQAIYTVNSLSPFSSGYMAQILNSYPSPAVDKNGKITLASGAVVPAIAPCGADPFTCVAKFTGAFPSTAQLDSGSARIDYVLTSKMSLFARYVDSPSSTFTSGSAKSINNNDTGLGSTSGTIGLTQVISATKTNDLRFNYTRSSVLQTQTAPTFSGNFSTLFPAGFAQPVGYGPRDMQFTFQFLGLVPTLNLAGGPTTDSRQTQFNIVDTFSMVKGAHTFKFGADFRIIDPNVNTPPYNLTAVFYEPIVSNVAQSQGGGPGTGGAGSGGGGSQGGPPPCGTQEVPLPNFICGQAISTIVQRNSLLNFRIPNWSFFAQDTWKIRRHLTLTYGARYEIAPAPHSLNGKPFFSLNNFDPVKCTSFSVTAAPPSSLCQVGVNPLGTPPYATTWGNIAPRLGLAYQISQDAKWATVLRAGVGIFYDTASDASAAAVGPFSPSGFGLGSIQFPAATADAQYVTPPSIQTAISPSSPYNSPAIAAAPNLKLPLTYGYNVALQQALGNQQSLTVSYVGAAGRKLIGAVSMFPITERLAGVQNNSVPISPTFSGSESNLTVFGNYSSSAYNALQAQFQRRFYRGFGATASYTWSHSLDDASNFNAGAAFPRSANRSSSDFDIRQTLAASTVYDAPTPFKSNKVASGILGHWSIDPIFHFQTALPVNVIAQSNFNGNILILQRPSLIPGIPLYVSGAACAAQNGGNACPGGRGINSAPITNLPNSKGVLPYPECEASVQSATGPSVVGSGAFCIAPADPLSSQALQGNAGRNLLRGFPLQQLDLDIHREFSIRDRARLRFEGDIFNIFNHPNFSAPQSFLSLPHFGVSNSMMNSSFGTGSLSSGGGNNPLYSLGGPRSVQLAVKIIF
ncbi:MAG TPA: carboxypeptidase regulatory-like domain-containing protein [Bryobacteraceae bacterium]|nr:carboxypeptidase regulatory-like domain-containing protein [Bryobacteraceae bacterium]